MPTILIVRGCRFQIYTDDHAPPHVRVIRGRAKMEIFLAPLRIGKRRGFSEQEARALLAAAAQHHQLLLSAWRHYHD